jgi:hypothetical protein
MPCLRSHRPLANIFAKMKQPHLFIHASRPPFLSPQNAPTYLKRLIMHPTRCNHTDTSEPVTRQQTTAALTAGSSGIHLRHAACSTRRCHCICAHTRITDGLTPAASERSDEASTKLTSADCICTVPQALAAAPARTTCSSTAAAAACVADTLRTPSATQHVFRNAHAVSRLVRVRAVPQHDGVCAQRCRNADVGGDVRGLQHALGAHCRRLLYDASACDAGAG